MLNEHRYYGFHKVMLSVTGPLTKALLRNPETTSGPATYDKGYADFYFLNRR
jgi:hypothetical protein